MTLALIVLVVFLVVWLFDSAKKREDKQANIKRTITNIQMQDELWCENYKKVIADLEEINNNTPITYNQLMPTLESLFVKYDIPDERTASEKLKATQGYLAGVNKFQDYGEDNYRINKISCGIHGRALPQKEYYLFDTGAIPLSLKIYYYTSKWRESTEPPPHFNNPELLLGEPNTTKVVDGFQYNYSHTGWAGISTEPHDLIYRICYLLTARVLYERGFNYNYDRRGSLLEQCDQRINTYEENKKKYPWLYK